jgi:hypothetical protein
MSEKKANKKKVVEKISHLIRPGGMALEQWQIVLRKQVARELSLRIKNTGDHPVFSTFNVHNPATQKSYSVFIGGEFALWAQTTGRFPPRAQDEWSIEVVGWSVFQRQPAY